MKPAIQTPLLDSLQTVLMPYRGKPVFFEPLHGNNGDRLIEMGSRELLARLGITLVNQPDQAAVILLNGGAGMTDIWVHGFETLATYNRRYPTIPLIICPSSFWFTQTDFPALFRDRRSPAWIYARERYSLETLQALEFPGDVRLGLDHDMAFHLQNSAYLRELRTKTAQKHILIVERNDPESVTGSYQPQVVSSSTSRWKQFIPKPIKQAVYRHVTIPLRHRQIAQHLGEQGIHTTFTQDCLHRLIQDDPSRATLPIFAADISDPALCNFHRFSQLIAEASVVAATRLHVGILAALLDKPTYIQAGSYHKIRGIYEYSLTNYNQVHLF